MKRAQYIFATGLLLVSTAAFAVTGPALPESNFVDDTVVMSGEADIVTPPISLYSAPDEPTTNNASGEINITIPYNPDEVDNPTSWTPDEPRNINLNSASHVESGPVFNMLIAFILSVAISTVIYKRKTSYNK